MAAQFYVRYYSGHTGRYGHEFLEFEYSDGRLRYANNSKCVPSLSRTSGGLPNADKRSTRTATGTTA